MKRSSSITIHCEPEIASEIGIGRIHRLASDIAYPARAALRVHGMFGDETCMRPALVEDSVDRKRGGARPGCDTPLSPSPSSPSSSSPSSPSSPPPPPQQQNHDTCHDATSLPMYDGFEVCRIARERVQPRADVSPDPLEIIFTGILIATFDNQDGRYHARTMVGANPFVISVPGIIEAPARPRGYYVDLITSMLSRGMPGGAEPAASQPSQPPSPQPQALLPSPHAAGGASGARAAREYDYVTRGDPRLPGIAEGLFLQAVMYHETGEAFCADKSCRMYNAHWQADLIRTQVAEPQLCCAHQNAMNAMMERGRR